MDAKSLMPFGRWGGFGLGSASDPFLSLRRDMDRLFDSFTQNVGASLPTGFLSPKVNVAETDVGLEVTAELPGVDQKNIDIDLTEGVLTLKASHSAEKTEHDEKKHFHLMERSSGTFMRRFALPFDAQADKVTATFDKGVLTVNVPRAAETAKPAHRIEVKSAPAG